MNTYRLIDTERDADGRLIDVYRHDGHGGIKKVRPDPDAGGDD